jgi:methylthioribose-1-phosphate isomerase
MASTPGVSAVPATLRYQQGALFLLDQRRLPGRCVEVRCSSATEVATAIRDMVVRGAPAIGAAAAYGVAIAAREVARRGGSTAELVAGTAAAAAELRDARPTASNLALAVDRMCAVAGAAVLDGAGRDTIADGLEHAADSLARFEVEASLRMGRLAADLLPGMRSLLVHCNAGALATVGRGTALAAVYELFELGRLTMTYVGETRPRLQGARLTAFELAQAGIPHTLIVDSLAATLMRRGLVDAVLVGADRVAANGDVANKVGTYALAVACHHHRVPLIVVAPTTTVDPTCPDGASIPIEVRDAAEIVMCGGEAAAPASTPVLNEAFDITPAHLVHALVTERGVVSPLGAESIAALLTPA